MKRFEVFCNVEKLYGKEFREALSQKPASVFLAEGSRIKVMKGARIFA